MGKFDVRLSSIDTAANTGAMIVLSAPCSIRRKLVSSIEKEVIGQKLSYGRMTLSEWTDPVKEKQDVVVIRRFTCPGLKLKYYEWAFESARELMSRPDQKTKVMIFECSFSHVDKYIKHIADRFSLLLVNMEGL